MPGKTEEIRILVQDTLQHFTAPYSEDIIRDVCLKIEENPPLKQRYEALKAQHKKDVVNNWIGKYTKKLTGLNSLRQVPLEEGHIISSYTKLGR